MQDNHQHEFKEQLARIVLTPNAISRHSKRLKKEVSLLGKELSLMQSQDMFARVLGLKDAHELAALMDKIASMSAISHVKITQPEIAQILHEDINLDNLDKILEFSVPDLQKSFAMSNTQMRILDEMHESDGGIYICMGINHESLSQLMASMLAQRMKKQKVNALIINPRDNFDYQLDNEEHNPYESEIYRPIDDCPHDYYDQDDYRQDSRFQSMVERGLNSDPDIVITNIDYADEAEPLLEALKMANNGAHVYLGLLSNGIEDVLYLLQEIFRERPKKMKSFIEKLQMVITQCDTTIKNKAGRPFLVQEMLPYSQEHKEKLLSVDFSIENRDNNFHIFTEQAEIWMKEYMAKEGFNLSMSLARHTAHDNLTVEQAQKFLAEGKKFYSFPKKS